MIGAIRLGEQGESVKSQSERTSLRHRSKVILVLGLMATRHFLGFVLFGPFWADESKAIIAFARATNPSNWISPVAPVLLLGIVLYLWLVWHLRQVIVGAAGHRSESQLFGLLTGRASSRFPARLSPAPPPVRWTPETPPRWARCRSFASTRGCWR